MSHGSTSHLETSSVVYFLQSSPGSPIKIGTTVRLSGRLVALSRSAGASLQVLGVMAGGREVERAVHRRFAQYQIESKGMGREWFRPVPSLLRFIADQATAWDGTDERPAPISVMSSFRSTPEWKAALENLAEFKRLTVADVIDHAIVAFARDSEYPKPIPKR